MSFADAVKTCFRKYFNFKGRAGRSEFWYFTLFNLLVAGAFYLFYYLLQLGLSNSPITIVVIALSWIHWYGILIPGLSVAVRRLHDTGRSGWLYLLILIPLVGAIVLIVFFTQDSQAGINKYGPDPKGIGNEKVNNEEI